MNRTVLIFAKAPRMGLAKTRLARGLGRTPAQRIARMGVMQTLRAAQDPRWQARLYAAPESDVKATFGGLWPAQLDRYSQGRGDLGTRLGRGLSEAPPGAALFIGTDAPDISRALLWQAFRALNRADCVVGPASDGGFWLLGLRRRLRFSAPFQGIRWSSMHTLSDLEANLPTGARITRLPTLIDIDEAEDWRAWSSRKRSYGG
ncbi:MAG: TIGR04282 family arsenosugar biosynthesis glycosyltransferase [Hyphomonadaceae bacterium]|nr:TIGR04282 family arsenosugar biosynthesis glycosyltransferase [Hyphomonadaceae bacterium]